MKTAIITAAVASLLTAVPAIAEAAPAPKPAADRAETAKAMPAKPTRYCFVDTVTGSRIPVRECKTRADWARHGIDIPADM